MVSFLDGFIIYSCTISCSHLVVCVLELCGREYGVYVVSCMDSK